MKYSSFPVVALLAFTMAFTACKKQEQCASGDTPEVCKGVQECFKSGTAVEVCREGERCHENDSEPFDDYQWGSRRTEV